MPKAGLLLLLLAATGFLVGSQAVDDRTTPLSMVAENPPTTGIASAPRDVNETSRSYERTNDSDRQRIEGLSSPSADVTPPAARSEARDPGA